MILPFVKNAAEINTASIIFPVLSSVSYTDHVLIYWTIYIGSNDKIVCPKCNTTPQTLQSNWKRHLTSNSQMTNRFEAWHEAEPPTPGPHLPVAHLMQ